MNQQFESIQIIPDFSTQAQNLQAHFLKCFENPLHASEDRFQWDYWHVPGQYTVVRSPAYNFFPEALFETLKGELEAWGVKNLGCGEISPSWISYYVEGCEQLFHADNPHGPWAFVFSLTDWEKRRFQGGETKILSESVLDYWTNFSSEKGFEEDTLIQRVEPHFNQLTVFDPRVPHGVETVRGEKDPRRARIVVHGWFLDPVPILEGGLENVELGEFLSDTIDPVLDVIESQGTYNGYLAFRVSIKVSGDVESVDLVQNTLREVGPSEFRPEDVGLKLSEALKKIQFPVAATSSVLVLPLVFK